VRLRHCQSPTATRIGAGSLETACSVPSDMPLVVDSATSAHRKRSVVWSATPYGLDVVRTLVLRRCARVTTTSRDGAAVECAHIPAPVFVTGQASGFVASEARRMREGHHHSPSLARHWLNSPVPSVPRLMVSSRWYRAPASSTCPVVHECDPPENVEYYLPTVL